jgi:hypothetical protein
MCCVSGAPSAGDVAKLKLRSQAGRSGGSEALLRELESAIGGGLRLRKVTSSEHGSSGGGGGGGGARDVESLSSNERMLAELARVAGERVVADRVVLLDNDTLVGRTFWRRDAAGWQAHVERLLGEQARVLCDAVRVTDCAYGDRSDCRGFSYVRAKREAIW